MTANVFTARIRNDINSTKQLLIDKGLETPELARSLANILNSVALMETALWATNPGWTAAFLARLGPAATIIDIGVWKGTPELYAAFPEAYHVLIEPMKEYEL